MRVLLKLTGELFGDESGVLSFPAYDEMAQRLIGVKDRYDLELAVVLGGGNIFRGRQADDYVHPIPADYMGMLATVINGIGLQEALERNGQDTRLQSGVEMRTVAEPINARKAISDLKKDRIVIFAGGLGHPNFTTDSAAAQYAYEIGADYLLKATNVDGVYDKDPNKHADAVHYRRLSYQEALVGNLNIMDATAFAMCRKNRTPILVFSVEALERLGEALEGKIGTLVSTVSSTE